MSGAHFNPAVTLTLAARGHFPWAKVAPYVLVQAIGALAGVVAAHGMFDLPLIQVSGKSRMGLHLSWGEFIATLGLLLVILQCSKHRPTVTPFAVAAYITSAYWFTSSTSFANPAVSLARAFTDTFCGIQPVDLVGFWAGQAIAVLLVSLTFRKN